MYFVFSEHFLTDNSGLVKKGKQEKEDLFCVRLHAHVCFLSMSEHN